MEDVKQTIAKNIASLRQSAKMTQIELAEKLNYSDKAISKWERGESIPDVIVLKAIANLFGVTLDYLLEEQHDPEAPQIPEPKEIPGRKHRNHKVITTLSVLIVWFVATAVYVVLDFFYPSAPAIWLSFGYAVPVSMIVWLVFNSIWFNRRRNYLIISLLMWTSLCCIFLSATAGGYPIWKMFALGIPGQIAIIVWSKFQRKNTKA